MARYASRTDRLAGLGTERWAVHQRAIERQSAGDEIVMLSIGEPDTPTPGAIVDAAVDSLRRGRTHYSVGKGEPDFLAAVARRYSTRLGRTIGAEQVIFMPGAHTALYAVCHAVLDEGDHLLVPEPYYAAYDGIFASTGAVVVPVPLLPEEEFHLQVAALDHAVTSRTRALVLNNPHNPTGAVLDPGRVAEIADFCERNDLWLISDEVYEDLVYEGTFESPLASAKHSDRIVVVSSVSKSHSMTGWRCGWAVGPVGLIDRVQQVAEAMMFGAQPFLQDATIVALDGVFDECDSMYADYQRRARVVVDTFADSDRLGARAPQGGIFVMVDVRDCGLSGVEFANRLLAEYNVATMPGESFGPSAAGHIRVSLTTDDDSIALGCRRMLELASSLWRQGA